MQFFFSEQLGPFLNRFSVMSMWYMYFPGWKKLLQLVPVVKDTKGPRCAPVPRHDFIREHSRMIRFQFIRVRVRQGIFKDMWKQKLQIQGNGVSSIKYRIRLKKKLKMVYECESSYLFVFIIAQLFEFFICNLLCQKIPQFQIYN